MIFKSPSTNATNTEVIGTTMFYWTPLYVTFMKGTVPTYEQMRNMSQEYIDSRSSDILNYTFTITIDGNTTLNTSAETIPVANNGTITWAVITTSGYMITTDAIGLMDSPNNIIWVDSKVCSTTVPNRIVMCHIKYSRI